MIIVKTNNIIVAGFYCYTDVTDDDNESPLDKAMENLSQKESCFGVALYLINHGSDNDKDKAKLLCGACEYGKLDLVKELIEHHHIIPSGKHYNSYSSVLCVILQQYMHIHEYMNAA